MSAVRRVPLVIVAALVAGAIAVVSGGPAASGQDLEEVRARAQEATQALADAESRLGELDQQITTPSTRPRRRSGSSPPSRARSTSSWCSSTSAPTTSS